MWLWLDDDDDDDDMFTFLTYLYQMIDFSFLLTVKYDITFDLLQLMPFTKCFDYPLLTNRSHSVSHNALQHITILNTKL